MEGITNIHKCMSAMNTIRLYSFISGTMTFARVKYKFSLWVLERGCDTQLI